MSSPIWVKNGDKFGQSKIIDTNHNKRLVYPHCKKMRMRFYKGEDHMTVTTLAIIVSEKVEAITFAAKPEVATMIISYIEDRCRIIGKEIHEVESLSAELADQFEADALKKYGVSDFGPS